MPAPVRIVMLGTGDFALPTFEHLLDSGHNLIALITQPDKPQGRRQEILFSPIKKAALARNVRVDQPENLNAPEGLDLIRSLQPDVLVTAAYGQILSAELLSIPPMGGINLHGSILPRYRGAAPVARAIQRGETVSGVTVIKMSPRVDAGGMLSFSSTQIEPNETAGQLEARLSQLGAPLISEAIAALTEGTATFLPQASDAVTKAPKLKKDDGRIDWTQPAQVVHNLVRAMQPWPMASTVWDRSPDGVPIRLIIHETRIEGGEGSAGEVIEAEGDRFVVATGQGAVRLIKFQLEGKKSTSSREFLLGHRPLKTLMH